MAAAGFLLGWQGAFLAAFIGIVLGGIYGICLMASGKKGRAEHFAFGPALCAGIAFSMFFGVPTLNWYLGLF
jgi:leader peptidase (prepilin peptidase)/N-methyltransferase